jgi:catechol 2,3-dioxygenase-like lactoylglutathione lyase family enzyme
MSNAIQSYRILIWSEDPDKLLPFYRDVLGFEVTMKLDLPNDYGYGIKINDQFRIWLGKHSDVQGKAKEPYRHMFNLYVDDVVEWYEKLKDRDDVTIVCEPVRTPPSTDSDPKYVFTFLDPDGNCLQFMNP